MDYKNKSKFSDKIGRLVYSAKNNLQNLQDILDYEPRYFSQKINFQDLPEDRLTTDSEKTIHIYLGKIAKDESIRSQSIYNDDFILGVLEEVFDRCEYENNIEIHIGSNMSKYFNGDENVEGYMNTNEEINYIKKILQSKALRKKYKKRASKIVYKDLCNTEDVAEHHKLFQELENSGINKMYEPAKPEINSENINSLIISKYLLRIFSNNDKFKQQIKNIVPKRLRTGDQSVYLYPIVEISIRLTDFLNGNKIQGGANKQYDYDRIINMILFNDNLENTIPGLYELQKILKSRFDYGDLKTFYFNTKGFAEHQKEKSKSSKLKSKIKTTTFVILGLLSAFKYGIYYNKKSLEEEKKLEIENIREAISKESLLGSDILQSRVNDMYLSFLEQYGEGEVKHELELKALIESILLEHSQDSTTAKYLDFYNRKINSEAMFFSSIDSDNEKITQKWLVDKYAILLKHRGYDLFPNKYLQETEYAMVETIKLLHNGDRLSILNKDIDGDFKTYEEYKCRKYSSYSYYPAVAKKNDQYSLVNGTPETNEYFLAAHSISGKYDTKNAKKLILDYIINSYPEVYKMARLWVGEDRYPKYTDINAISMDIFVYLNQSREIERFRDWIVSERYDYKKLLHYLDGFAKQKIKEGIIPEVRPGYLLEKYKPALSRSSKLSKKHNSELRDMLRNISNEPSSKGSFISEYRTVDGELFQIYKISKNQTDYIIPYNRAKKAGGLKYFQEFFEDFKSHKK